MISINEITGQTAESSVMTASAIGKLQRLAQELRQSVADNRMVVDDEDVHRGSIRRIHASLNAATGATSITSVP